MASIWETLIFKGLTTLIWKENNQTNNNLEYGQALLSRVELISGDISPAENMVE